MADVLRALADPTRRRILAWLEGRKEPATVDDVTAAVGVHRTVAFEHLELLGASGLVERGVRAGARGRPPRTYRLTGEAFELSHPPRQHRLLATLLASAIAQGTEPRRVAAVYGGGLAAGSRNPAEGIGSLESLGGRYEVGADRIQAHNCVFREACEAARQVVCEVQAGLLQGALAAAGWRRAVTPEGPDGSGGCRFKLSRGDSG